MSLVLNGMGLFLNSNFVLFRLTIGLSISLALLAIELISFLAGVSMFLAGISMLCILLQFSCNSWKYFVQSFI